MAIERDVLGVPKFMGRDGEQRYRVEFTSEDGTSSGVEYLSNLTEDTLYSVSVAYGVSEFRVETPFMHEARRKQEYEDSGWRRRACVEIEELTPPPAVDGPRHQLNCLTDEQLEIDIGCSGKYQAWWIGAMKAERDIRRARAVQDNFLLESRE